MANETPSLKSRGFLLRKKKRNKVSAPYEMVDLKAQIDHLLDEIRIVLPGTQTLLGFQLASVFSSGFEKLEPFLKQLHLLSLGFIALGIIFLIAPAAYDRIAERDKNTPHFHNFATLMVVLALMSLIAGLSIESYVIVQFVLKSQDFAVAVASSIALLSIGLWFGYSIYRRKIH